MEERTTHNVLVVSGGGYQGLTLIKGLSTNHHIYTVVADCYYENIGQYFSDAFYQVPPVASPNFINALFQICESELIHVVLPSTEHEIATLSQNKERFNTRGISVAVSDSNLVEILQNKTTTHDFLESYGLSVLPRVNLDYVEKYPIFCKPNFGWGSKGILTLKSESELQKYDLVDLEGNYLILPFLYDFQEYSIDFAIGFDKSTSELAIRERVVSTLGFASISTYLRHPTIERMVSTLVQILIEHGGVGLFNVQIIRDLATDRYFFSDINPRIGTSAVLAYQAGVNLPDFVCRSRLHGESKYREGTQVFQPVHPFKMIRYLEELYLPISLSLGDIECIVFDLDDTLLNQKAWILGKIEKVWLEHSSKLPDKEEFYQAALKLLEEKNQAYLFDVLSYEFSFEESFKWELINTYRRSIPSSNPLFPDTLYTLRRLKQKGYRLGLLTDNPIDSQKRKLRFTGLDEMFDVVVFAQDFGSKPSKSAYSEVTRRAGLNPDQLIMVGDNLHRDILGSLQSGYRYGMWITRKNSLLQFDKSLCKPLVRYENRYWQFDSLRKILYCL